MADRKAASVLPEPVGAATSVCLPARIAGHASSCAGVGPENAEENHAATAGWNCSDTPRSLGQERPNAKGQAARPRRQSMLMSGHRITAIVNVARPPAIGLVKKPTKLPSALIIELMKFSSSIAPSTMPRMAGA